MGSILERLAIATITWARDEGEAALLKKSLTELSTLELPVYITDAGSAESFRDFLKQHRSFNIHEQPVKGVWPQAKISLLNAARSGAEYILYTEPDKFDFFRNLFSDFNSTFPVYDVGILLYSRSAKSFASFPPFQQMTETTINNCCRELIQRNADYTYGPFIMKKDILPHLLQLPDNIGWGWRPYAFNIAKRLGYDVEFAEADFFCPADQKQDTPRERIYRIKQLQQNIEGLLLSTTASL